MQFFGEYIGGQYHYYPREGQNKSQVVEQIITRNRKGYTIHNAFSTANSETVFAFILSFQNEGPITNIHMNLTKTMLFDMQYDTSKVASLDLQLEDGKDHYRAKLIKGDLLKGDEPIIDATIYDAGTTKFLYIIFYDLVPLLMKMTSLTRSNELFSNNMTSILQYFNMSYILHIIGNVKFARD